MRNPKNHMDNTVNSEINAKNATGQRSQ